MTDTISDIAARIDAAAEAALDYEESHRDAGDAYSHLPREGGWIHTEGGKRLQDWIRVAGIHTKELAPDDLANLVLDNFRMITGNRFDQSYGNPDLFVIDSYPVQEIETRIDKTQIAPDATEQDWEKAKSACDTFFGNDDLAYMTSDRVWYGVIDKTTLETIIADYAA